MTFDYYSTLPISPIEVTPITEYHARWYGRVLIRLSNWLRDLAYVGARKVVR